MQAKFGQLSDSPECPFLLILKSLAHHRRHREEDRDANVINGQPCTRQNCVKHEADTWFEWPLAGTGFFETGGLGSGKVTLHTGWAS